MRFLALLAALSVGALASAGTLYGLSRDGNFAHRLVTIDTSTGAATTLFSFNVPYATISSGYLTYNPVRDRFLMTAFTSSSESYLVEIDVATRSATQRGIGVPTVFFEGIQYSAGHGGLVVSYGANSISGNLALLDASDYGRLANAPSLGLADGDTLSLDAAGDINVLDTNNPTGGFQRNQILNPFGAATVVGVGANIFSTSFYELEYDADLGTTFANTTTALYSVNASSTSLTPIGGFGSDYNIIGLAVLPVPEPATLAVLALGVLAVSRRRRAR